MRRADALALMAETFVHQGSRKFSTADRYQVVVHVEAETLRDSTAGRCEIEHGPAVAAETARRLACDASLVTVTENERGDALDVGRKTRSIPPAIRRALNSRDQGCRFPGCTHRRYVDAHHIHHWVHGGETTLGNLVTLCRFHHRYVHEENVTIQMQPNGNWRFLKPDGTAFDEVRPAPTPAHAWTDLIDAHDEQGIIIDSQTAATRWRGEGMDYGLAIQVLFQQADRAKQTDRAQQADDSTDGPDVSAETSDANQDHDHEHAQDREHDAEWRRHDEEGTSYLMRNY
jgi:hypothetical protein